MPTAGRLAGPALAAVLLAGACAGGDGADASNGTTGDASAASSTVGSASSSSAAGSGGTASSGSSPGASTSGAETPGTATTGDAASGGAAGGTAAATVEPGRTSIVVDSTPEQYFVLYVRPSLAQPTELPVAIARGQAGTTTLTDGRDQLPQAHYRVATFQVSAPGDVDGDGVDDLTELGGGGGGNPLNAAPALEPATGANRIVDRQAYEQLSYQGDEVARDAYLAGLEFVKFWIVDTDTDHPSVYFMNTERYRAHPEFGSVVGISSGRGPVPGKLRGDIVWLPDETAPDGSKGVYRFAFQPGDAYAFEEIALAYETLVTSMPMLDGNLLYYPFPQSALPLYEKERASYDAYRVPVLVER